MPLQRFSTTLLRRSRHELQLPLTNSRPLDGQDDRYHQREPERIETDPERRAVRTDHGQRYVGGRNLCFAAEVGEKSGEIGIQLGVRWVDRQIVPDDSTGLGWVPGIQGAWALNDRWAVFGDVNLSVQDSREFCSGTDVCNASTPESLVKSITVGIERRSKPGSRNGRWVLGLGAGWIDVEWNGIQLHKGMWSLSFGRRTPLGHGFGVLRWCLRVENGIGIGVDPQLTGSIKRFRMTNAAFLVGWGAGFGGRY